MEVIGIYPRIIGMKIERRTYRKMDQMTYVLSRNDL